VLWAPSVTVGAYRSGAICGYCPIELIPVRRPFSSDLSVQDPIFYFHGKVFDRRKSRAAIWVFVLVVTHQFPSKVVSAIAFSATNVIVKIAKKIVLRDEGFIRIGNYLTETARISPPIFYF
jgi:hypothetical protein